MLKNKSKLVFLLVMGMLFAACAGEAGPQGEAGAPGEVSDAQVAAAVAEALAEPEAEVGGLSLIHI